MLAERSESRLICSTNTLQSARRACTIHLSRRNNDSREWEINNKFWRFESYRSRTGNYNSEFLKNLVRVTKFRGRRKFKNIYPIQSRELRTAHKFSSFFREFEGRKRRISPRGAVERSSFSKTVLPPPPLARLSLSHVHRLPKVFFLPGWTFSERSNASLYGLFIWSRCHFTRPTGHPC